MITITQCPCVTIGKKKGKAHGTRGKGKGKARGQGFGKVHLVSSISTAPPSTSTIATITPQGLLQCIAVADPETSSYGNGPYASFNEAMTLAQCIGERPSLRTVQAIEEQVMGVPTPCSSPPPLSPAESIESLDIEERRAASAPPVPTVPEEVRDAFGYTAEERAAISPCFLPGARPPLNNGKPRKLPKYQEDIVTSYDPELEWNGDERGASGWEDLFDDGYVLLELISHTSNSFLECAATNIAAAIGEVGNALQYKLACPCKSKELCTCSSVPREWLVDSGATMHMSPVKSDFIDLESVLHPEQLRTANGDESLVIQGRGSVLIQHVFEHKGESRIEMLRIQNVAYVPGVVLRPWA